MFPDTYRRFQTPCRRFQTLLCAARHFTYVSRHFTYVSRHFICVSRHFIFVLDNFICVFYHFIFVFEHCMGQGPWAKAHGPGPWAGPMGRARARALTFPAETNKNTSWIFGMSLSEQMGRISAACTQNIASRNSSTDSVDSPDSAETVSGTAAPTPCPHAPGARMT